jgi:hypothetical protein
MTEVDKAIQRIQQHRAAASAAAAASQEPDPNVARLTEAQEAIWQSRARAEMAYGAPGQRQPAPQLPLSEFPGDWLAMGTPGAGLTASWWVERILSHAGGVRLVADVASKLGVADELRRWLAMDLSSRTGR